jgi:hypothetical protein
VCWYVARTTRIPIFEPSPTDARVSLVSGRSTRLFSYREKKQKDTHLLFITHKLKVFEAPLHLVRHQQPCSPGADTDDSEVVACCWLGMPLLGLDLVTRGLVDHSGRKVGLNLVQSRRGARRSTRVSVHVRCLFLHNIHRGWLLAIKMKVQGPFRHRDTFLQR